MPAALLLPPPDLQDLCERHEKGVLHEHQRALHKYSVMKRQMMSATVQPKEQASVEQLESRIVQVKPRRSVIDPLSGSESACCLLTNKNVDLVWVYIYLTHTHPLGVRVCLRARAHFQPLQLSGLHIPHFRRTNNHKNFNFTLHRFTFQAQLLLMILSLYFPVQRLAVMSSVIFNPSWQILRCLDLAASLLCGEGKESRVTFWFKNRRFSTRRTPVRHHRPTPVLIERSELITYGSRGHECLNTIAATKLLSLVSWL